MRKRRTFVLILFFLLCSWGKAAPAAQAESATDLERVGVGSRPPDFLLKDLDGTSHSLKQYEGKKNVVLVFYRGHW